MRNNSDMTDENRTDRHETRLLFWRSLRGGKGKANRKLVSRDVYCLM